MGKYRRVSIQIFIIPLLTGFCDDDNTDPNIKTDEGLRKCAMQENEYGVLSASLNGSKLQETHLTLTKWN